MTPARRAALALLDEVDRGHRLDVAWERRSTSLGERDRAWVHDAVFGTLRMRGRIDHLLDARLRRGVDSVAPPLLRVLRFGAYQLLFMDGTPEYAAVSQSVEQGAALGGRGAADLVNAVLRAVGRAGVEPSSFPSIDGDPVAHLSTWGSHPRWIVERWIERFGIARARQIVEAGNRVPGLYLRPIGATVDGALAALADAGVDAAKARGEAPLVALAEGTRPREVLRVVPAIVQDPAAAAVCWFMEPVRGELVADLCAAPGGKAVALHDGGARVIAMDRSAARLRRLRETVERLRLDIPVAVSDAGRPGLDSADVVLVDAPCSGTGTFSRGPDARWRLTPASIPKLEDVQRRILRGAAGVVRTGGRLIYSTCTLEHEENRRMVDSFLAEHAGFELDGADAMLEVLPGDVSDDGAFAARMRRVH